MQKLLIATSNAGKLAEYQEQLKDLPLELVSLKDVGLGSIEETGTTLEENALLKAKTYFKLSGLPCVSDDGGMEIAYLNNQPGMYSRRWVTGDENVSDEEIINFTIAKMSGVPKEKRGAKFRMVMAFVDANGEAHTAEASMEGEIAEIPSTKIEKNLPYRSVLFITALNKIWVDLVAEEDKKYSQRVAAIRKLKPIIAQTLGGVA